MKTGRDEMVISFVRFRGVKVTTEQAFRELDEDVAKLGDIDIHSLVDSSYPAIGDETVGTERLVRVVVYSKPLS